MASKSGEEPQFNRSGNVFGLGNPIDLEQIGSQVVNNSETLPNPNDDYVFDGLFNFEEFCKANDDRLPVTFVDSPSTLVLVSNLRNVAGHIKGASFESCLSALQRHDLGLGPSLCPSLQPRRAAPQRRGIGTFQRAAPRGTPRGLGSGTSRPPQRGTPRGYSKGIFEGNAIPVPQGGDSSAFPGNFVLESRRGHVLSPSRTTQQRLPPRLSSPFVSPQSKHRQQSWQSNNHLEPMHRVVKSPSRTMPSALKSQVILPDDNNSHGVTIPVGFDQHTQSPRAPIMAPEISLGSIFGGISDHVDWSEEALQFFAQHKTGWEMTTEERKEASAFYDSYDNSEPVRSTRMLKRGQSEDRDSAVMPANMLRTEVPKETFQEDSPTKDLHFPGTSGQLYSTSLVPLNVPYVSNAQTMDLGQQPLQRETESFTIMPGSEQYPPMNNVSSADPRLVRNVPPHITLQDHLKKRREMADKDSRQV